MKRYEQIPHTADLAAKIYGRNMSEIFENAAYAMFNLMSDLKGLEPRETVKIELKAPDAEDLLISWLNELLYVSYEKQIVCFEFHVLSLDKNKLKAEAKGQKLEDTRQIHTEIKAATYHDLEIKKISSGYEVVVVFDV